ncbi:MAG TPA: hypothetical protein VFH36_18990 [Acidimicrobiales bacterium]|nr:hypothetical protein [Acidimicrobiales bacterium]
MSLGDQPTTRGPTPAVGATLIAAAAVVLILGLVWLARDQSPSDRLVVPTADGVTLPTNGEGEPIELPPSQPAVAVSFGADGQLIRPEPVRARVIDESGNEVLVALAPNTTVDTVTGEIVPTIPTTSRPGSTTPTTRPGGSTTPTTSSPTTAPPTTPTTAPPTTPTTAPPTTPTTEPPPTTTEPPPTSDPTIPDPGLGTILDDLLP